MLSRAGLLLASSASGLAGVPVPFRLLPRRAMIALDVHDAGHAMDPPRFRATVTQRGEGRGGVTGEGANSPDPAEGIQHAQQ